MSLSVLDGDLIAYKASAASERRFITATHKQSNRSKDFDNKTVFREWLSSQDKWEESDFDIEQKQEAEPIEYCLHTIKQMIKNIHAPTGCGEYKVVVQGEGNFRDNILLPTKYKSSRSDLVRPVHLTEAKSYLIGKYKAEIAVGQETDDVLSCYAFEGFKKKKRIVQSSIDKDAKQCSGWLYDWDKMSEPVFISGLGKLFLNNKGKVDGYGRKWLYYQATVGDPTDTYKPTELTTVKYGEKSALKDFEHLETDKECWQKVKELYEKWYPEPFHYIAWTGENISATYLDIMQMYFDAAHMRRWNGDRIVVKDVLTKMEII